MKAELTARLGSVLIASCVLFLPLAAIADEINVGLPPFDAEINFIESPHLVAKFVRAGVLDSLLRVVSDAAQKANGSSANDRVNFQLSIAEGFHTDPVRNSWIFKIRPGSRFLNGNSLIAEDVAFSLRRCRARQSPAVFAEIEVVRAFSETGPLKTKLWSVDEPEVRVSAANQVSAARLDAPMERDFLRAIESCPILEQRSSLVFGDELGKGGNMITSGRYRLAELKFSQEIRLERIRGAAAGEVAAFNLRSIETPRHGVTALRTGTLDLYYVRKSEITAEMLDSIAGDKTLRAVDCRDYWAIHRSGLVFRCSDNPNLPEIRYQA